ncbi:MAG: two pore domain potassium channel family protein [Rhodocyclaceae bacterium]|nr:two pore domain potassium channel family protein [Rhodocyclaceae bacterium]
MYIEFKAQLRSICWSVYCSARCFGPSPCMLREPFCILGKPAAYSYIVQHLTYFSFVSLTTRGFGDITPVHPIAKSMTLLAAVFGTL